MKTIFDRYPQLRTLKGLVPEDVVEREVGGHADEFEELRKKAHEKIKTVKLCDIFPEEVEAGQIQLKNFLGHWGNVSVEEICKIALITKFFKPKKVFEFGTYNGLTTMQMALNTPEDTEIYTLDLPPDGREETKFELSELDKYVAKVFYDKFSTEVGSYFKGTKEGDKITQIFHDSATFDYTEFHGQMDLIFIDAGHDYQNKKSDTENSLKMLSENGIILWDNYDDVLNPDVTRYLAELADELPLFHLRGTPVVAYWNKK